MVNRPVALLVVTNTECEDWDDPTITHTLPKVRLCFAGENWGDQVDGPVLSSPASVYAYLKGVLAAGLTVSGIDDINPLATPGETIAFGQGMVDANKVLERFQTN